METWWGKKLTAYIRDAHEPQTVREIVRGCFGDSSQAPDEGSVHNWLRFGARFGVLDCDWSRREHKYTWRPSTEFATLAALDSIEAIIADLRQTIGR